MQKTTCRSSISFLNSHQLSCNSFLVWLGQKSWESFQTNSRFSTHNNYHAILVLVNQDMRFEKTHTTFTSQLLSILISHSHSFATLSTICLTAMVFKKLRFSLLDDVDEWICYRSSHGHQSPKIFTTNSLFSINQMWKIASKLAAKISRVAVLKNTFVYPTSRIAIFTVSDGRCCFT